MNYLCMNLEKLPQSIHFDPESNTYILGEYDEYMLKQICSNYSCFWPFMGQSQIIIWLLCIKHKYDI